VILPFRTAADWAREGARVAAHLRAGGLIAYPTETVYGLGSALREDALERLAAFKGGRETKPFLLLLERPEEAPGLEWNDCARQLARAFWPGPLTLALRAEPGRYPARVVGAEGTVAVRSSPHPAVRALVSALGEPITSTSANLPGAPPATRTEEVLELARALGNPADLWVLDGGALPASAPSTVVDCASERPRILREGAIVGARLRGVVENLAG
jgi:L-threonylcarbamoyladenylate synthase